MLQVELCKSSWTGCCRLAGIFNSVPDLVCSEEADVVVQRLVTQGLTSYANCLRFGSMWNYGCKMITESTGYFVLVRYFLVVESDWLIWRGAGFLTCCCTHKFP